MIKLSLQQITVSIKFAGPPTAQPIVRASRGRQMIFFIHSWAAQVKALQSGCLDTGLEFPIL